jgi:hypothetical protein
LGILGSIGLEDITVMSNGDPHLREFSGRPVNPMSSPLHLAPFDWPHMAERGILGCYRWACDGCVVHGIDGEGQLLAPPIEKGVRSFGFLFLSSFICVEDIAANHDIIHPVFAGPTGTPAEKAFNEGVYWGLEETGITVNVEAYLVSLAGFA